MTQGCAPNLYCGDDTITRGEMAALLSRAENLPDSTTDHFVDDNTSIFEPGINKVADARITLGCNPPANTNFCPNDNVTRAQMAGFLTRALGLTPIIPPPPASTTSTTTTTPTPANPGDAVDCGDFATWAPAQAYYDFYFPFYGDVAGLDGDNDGIACETHPGAP